MSSSRLARRADQGPAAGRRSPGRPRPGTGWPAVRPGADPWSTGSSSLRRRRGLGRLLASGVGLTGLGRLGARRRGLGRIGVGVLLDGIAAAGDEDEGRGGRGDEGGESGTHGPGTLTGPPGLSPDFETRWGHALHDRQRPRPSRPRPVRRHRRPRQPQAVPRALPPGRGRDGCRTTTASSAAGGTPPAPTTSSGPRSARPSRRRSRTWTARWPTQLLSRLSFQTSTADDGSDLAAEVRAAEKELGDGARRLVYLSVPPSAIFDMIAMLGRERLTDGARLVIEKPFGLDLESARKLDAALKEVVEEDQVFRIDHFLGKEAVQNILALRFANGLFEPAWNRHSIESVQIDVPEELDVQGRGSFYEGTGCLRDMISTHLCQLLGFVALEDPGAFKEQQLRDAKSQLFQDLVPFDKKSVVFGQYDGYRDEKDVDPDSDVETFVAIEARIDNDRWRGRPVLPPHRQGAGRRLPHDHPALPQPGLRLVGRPLPRPRPGAQRADPPAHRRAVDLPRDARQATRARHGAGRGRHEGRLRPGLPARRPARGLRAADPRRDARRPDPVHPVRRGRPALAGLPAAARRPAGGAAVREGLVGTSGRPGPAAAAAGASAAEGR